MRNMVENLENFQEEFDNLDTKYKLKFIADLLPYGLPKYQPTEMEKKGNRLEAQENIFQRINQTLIDQGNKTPEEDMDDE